MTLKVDTDATKDFAEAIDSLETARAILGLCGKRVYVIKENDGTNTSTWVSVAAIPGTTNYRITAQPRLEALIGTQTMRLKITLENYPNHAGISPTIYIAV